jgi:hypothetical protein
VTDVVSGTTGGWARCQAVSLSAVVVAVLVGCSVPTDHGGDGSVSAPDLVRLGVVDARVDGPASTPCEQVTVRIELAASTTP